MQKVSCMGPAYRLHLKAFTSAHSLLLSVASPSHPLKELEELDCKGPACADHSAASYSEAGLGLQLTGPSISLTASDAAIYLQLHKLQDEDLASLQHGHLSALSFTGNHDVMVGTK